MKKLSMILLIFWTISVVMILTFGTEVASFISENISKIIHSEKNKLEDVVLHRTDIPIEQEIYLETTIYPDTVSSYDIIYTSLTPDVFEVINNAYLVGKRFEGEQQTGQLLITSRKHEDFEKIVDLSFYKTYPQTIETSLCDEYNIVKEDLNVYLGVPFYINTSISPSIKFVSEKDLECIYDENLFDCVYDDLNVILTPKYLDYKLNDSFSPIESKVIIKLNGNEIKSYDLIINPLLECTKFDNIKINNLQSGIIGLEEKIFVKEEVNLILFDGNNKLITPYTIVSDNDDLVNIKEGGVIEFLKAGIVNLNITLPNGYQQSFSLQIRNKLGIPVVSGVNFDENNEIVIKQETYDIMYFNYNDDVSYEKITYTIDEGITNSYEAENNGIILTGNRVGKYNLTVTIDDGVEEPIILNYVVNVINNERSFSSIISQFSRFLAKILGHMSFFVLEAMLAFFMMYYYKGKNKWLNAIIYFSIGLVLASLTELIQYFIPGRFCTFKDILIDMGGYLIGFIISVVSYKIIFRIKNKKSHVVN